LTLVRFGSFTKNIFSSSKIKINILGKIEIKMILSSNCSKMITLKPPLLPIGIDEFFTLFFKMFSPKGTPKSFAIKEIIFFPDIFPLPASPTYFL